MNFRIMLTVVLVAPIFLAAAPAFGQEVPREINYQGFLTDASGSPLNGDYSIRFRLYPDSLQSTSSVWVENHSDVPVNGGLFNVILGSATPIPDDVMLSAAVSDLWLGVDVAPGPELYPRIRITSVPLAIRAAVADSVLNFPTDIPDGHSLDADDGSPTDRVYVNQYGNVGIGTTNPDGPFEIRQDANIPAKFVIHNRNTDTNSATKVEFKDEELGYTYIENNASTNANYPSGLIFVNENPDGNMTFKTADGDAMHIEDDGDVGIGTMTPNAKLDVAGTVEVDGFKMPAGASAGQVLTTNVFGVGTWEDPAALPDGDWVINGNEMYATVSGDVGVGTTDPRADFHVHGPGTVGTLLITPNASTSGDSRLNLSQDWNGNYGGYVKYDGGLTDMEIGYKNGTSDLARIKIDGLTPWVEMYGQNRQAVFSMGVDGNGSVMLPSEAIASAEMQDEPGVAAAVEGSAGITLDGTKQTLIQRSITVPTTGYVLVIGSCQGRAVHTTGTVSSVNFGVSEAAGDLPNNQDVAMYFPSALTSGTYDHPITVHSVFDVASTGTYTYYLIGEETSGDIKAFDMQISLLYVPTAYGDVNHGFAGPGGTTPDDGAAVGASPTAAEIEAERAESERLYVERIERELAEIRAQLEELRAQQ